MNRYKFLCAVFGFMLSHALIQFRIQWALDLGYYLNSWYKWFIVNIRVITYIVVGVWMFYKWYRHG